MNNNQVNKADIDRLKGHFQAKYAFPMDEWTAIMLYEIVTNFQSFSKQVEASKGEIEKATSQIKGQIVPVHFSDKKQAFFHSFGKSLPYCFAIIIVSLLSYFLMKNYLTNQKSNAILANEAKVYTSLIQAGKVREQNGYLFLSLSKLKDRNKEINFGKEFIQTRNPDIIWVPLGMKKD